MSKIVQRHGLWRGNQQIIATAAGAFTTTINTWRVPAVWADEVIWNLVIEGVTNTPSALAVNVNPQWMMEHTRNQIEENRFPGNSQTPLWANHSTADLIDGAFAEVDLPAIPAVPVGTAVSGSPFSTVVANADANNGAGAVQVSKRVKGGHWNRLQFIVTGTAIAGTTRLQMSAECILRG